MPVVDFECTENGKRAAIAVGNKEMNSRRFVVGPRRERDLSKQSPSHTYICVSPCVCHSLHLCCLFVSRLSHHLVFFAWHSFPLLSSFSPIPSNNNTPSPSYPYLPIAHPLPIPL